MRPRQGLIETFSSFVKFTEDYFDSWVIDPQLRRSMDRCLKTQPKPPASEKFWVHFWHKQWQTPSKAATGHLLAYLQETCYWSAYKTVNAGFAGMHLSIADLFQIALTHVERILNGFDPDRGSTLKDYASVAFKSIIRDILRQRRETDICSDWALLRKLSQKRLRESLQNAGINSEDQLEQYILAWNCFKTIYVPTQATGTRQLTKPDTATWEAIAKFYNSECKTILSPQATSVSGAIIERWLSQCAQWARLYLYPTVGSLNTSKSQGETREIVEDLADPNESMLAELIAEEEAQDRQTQQIQLKHILTDALGRLKPDVLNILRLYYEQGLTQQDIAEQLDMKQYTVSRRLTKARETLLKALAQWTQNSLGQQLTTDALAQMSSLLEEWLHSYSWK
ncbi:sigma-70 family RNA polymerase sigma factor [Capilliphycus salinus ALCB114379]|uniref:sigma-70 family RNA polymerase sigma factor n=1 Tax=Capilliphycus salinus TaxID=2768948 RepID=UPI0039A76020